ncbi:hypothetical protein evm_000733 [Chilo suppressalis]|nr:hypothetical protein evm_000733 [Chilo suppressalis]
MPLILIFLGLVTHSLGVSLVKEPSDCESQGEPPKCPANEQFVNCKVECPNSYCPVRDGRGILICDPPRPCPSGCTCKAGYLRKSRQEPYCIEASTCPPVNCTRPNEIWNPSPPNCLRERCADAFKPQEPCDRHYRDYIPKCVCQYGYYRNESDICVPLHECKKPKCKDPHAVINYNPWPCRPTCAKPNTRDCNKPFVAAGCVCDNGYVLSAENGTCIKVEECPCGDPCAPNATLSNFITSCPYEYCPREDTRLYPCDPVVPSPTGCACKANYKRLNSDPDKCVLATDCPFVCPIPRECRPTCANPNPPSCFDMMPASLGLTDPVEMSGNVDGCQCQKGYILSDPNGKCIKIEECPQNQSCNGDPNAVVKTCPWPCPSTCARPNTVLCYKACLPVGCQCKPGYILTEENGQCVLPKDCKGGDPCGPNGTFSDCSTRCPELYCPKNDDRVQPVCDPIYPCPPGCVCKINHRRLSYEDERCIVSSECPPVNCTRQNEVWAPCPSDCLAEYCENVNDPPVVCNTLLLNCQPKCVCAEGYFRNSTTDLCVPANECANYNNPCRSPCAPTCAEPNPQGCKSPQRCCKEGYILSERNGKCIKIEDCPKQIGCNGDPNAVVKKCPAPCPSTCDHPEPIPCKKMCLEVGCECAPGYLKSNGKCIPANQCPGGDPCGPNGTYVECAYRCPNQFCPKDDSRLQIACKPPRDCPPGCACKLNHKRLSYEDDRCIVSTDCPPVECTRPNEVWSACPTECPVDYCENVNDPPSVCYTLVLNCQPSCICADGYYRNSSGICIPAKDCEGFNPCLSKCSPTCAVPNPPNCGCLSQFKCCKDGYILTERNGTCVKIEDCPNTSCGKNEKYVVNSNECRKTCANNEGYKPGDVCKPITGCICKPGYVRTNDGGTGPCIPENECPILPVCGKNEVPTKSRIICPPQSCESIYTTYLCDDVKPEPGCDCINGYLRNTTGVCIPNEECPPPGGPICGENEIPTKDRIVCPPQTCESLYTLYKCDSNREPEAGCNCIDGYLRNSSGVCIPSEKCPPQPSVPICGKNEVATKSRIICPPQSCESIYSSYLCEDVKPEPGCDCIDGYLRNATGDCIPNEQCPPPGPVCGENEIPSMDKIVCPPQTCESLYTLYKCDSNREPEPGCNCIDGYLRDSSGVCIPSEKCPPQPSECPVSKECRPTCASPNPPNCPACQPAESNIDGCQCQEGYILSEAGGKCIRVEECPKEVGCNGDPNAVVKSCPNPCPSTCKQPQNLGCKLPCLNVGCECAPGYLKSSSCGKCIQATQCPGGDPCGPNGTFVQCAFRCPDQYCPRNDGPQPVCMPPLPCRSGCACKLNHKRLSNKDNRCILTTDCPPVNCTRPNEIWSSCPSACLSERCENVNDPPVVCNSLVLNCQPKCICADGYYRNSSGICIPANKCKGFNPCLSRCTPTCLQPNPPKCGKPSQYKCCKSGYILTERNGTCVKNDCCPKIKCGKNEVASDSKIICPPQTCASKYTLYRCRPDIKPEPGCNCIKGYLRDPSGVCIPSEQCPPIRPICQENEVATDNRIICPPQTCDSLYIKYNCLFDIAKPEPGCDCIKGYLRNSSGICIPKEKCPRLPPSTSTCGENEVFSKNKIVCPPQTCESRYIKYRCVPNIKPVPGCNCIAGYLRDKRGICIPSKLCSKRPPIVPLCGKNEVYSTKKITCPPQTCAGRFALYKCNILAPTEPGCNCIPGYLRNVEGICIPKDQCPPPPLNCGPNEIAANEKIECPPQTCESIYTTYNCEPSLPRPGCNCINGYLRNASGICIPSEKCSLPPKGCKGDPNATTKRCPNPCPATCQNPNPTGVCPRACLVIGCECNPGYLLSNGTCVLPKDCPGGVSCPANEQYVGCKIDCPNNYCPTDDNRGILICDPAFPCPGGCVCKGGYLRKSYEERNCIESSKCPPVNCTRPNEVWNPSPPNCIRATCEDKDKGPNDPCYLPYLSGGRPQCVCRDGYYRNGSDICIPASECPFVCPISSKCRPTCAVPNPQNCPDAQPAKSNIDGCQCQRGYILSNENGKCIRIEECPENQGCNGDPNAVVKECPSACPSTCSSPDNNNCKRACASVGCQCAPGYLRPDPDGKCIPVGQCPGGDPCGPNSTFVSCAFRCPNQYCPKDDSRVQIACKPGRNCPSGCGCKLNYKRLSYDDDRCILSTDCPPVNCTRPNEVWSSCPSDCLAEECGNVNDPPSVCNTLLLNCQPQCICAEGYYRNGSEICIPANECEGYNPCLSKCAPTCAEPNPPNCNYPFANTCCKDGYILSERNGKCIRIEDCPKNITCNGDRHAIVKKCPLPNPPTCAKPRSERSEKKCEPVGCECAPGYIRSEPGGECIPATKCPGGDPCGPNGTFVSCSFRCPNQYCPKSDSPFQVACMPPLNCPPGCACKANYKRLSSSDDRCILASDCPPVQKKCTKPNEILAACPTPCDVNDCKNVNEPPRACIAAVINCHPQCICTNGTYRNSKGDCVPAEQCENYNPCLSECAPTCAEPNPPDCDHYSEQKCCRQGWILSERRGRCIKIEDCPKNITCNGDPNAVVKQCPAPCPSTCDSPNQVPCRKACLPVGCECAPGYLRLDYNGKCVKPDECPGGYPCKKNEVFVPCRNECDSSYCPKDDSRDVEKCSNDYCLSGCICKFNYRRKNYDDRTCIVASDCPPVNCTRPNEEWSSCPSACLQESCEDVGKKPVICNTLLLNCQPKCICCEGYYRNSTGICVSPDECPCN